MMRSDSFRKMLSVVLLMSLLLSPAPAWPTRPVAAAQADARAAQSVAAVASAPLAAESRLYRTHITLRHPTDRARLEKLGVVVLQEDAPTPARPLTGGGSEGGGQAIVLADADQLEALARLGFRPQATDDADALIAHHAADRPALAAAWGELRQRIGTDKRMTAASLSVYPLSSVAQLSSLDDDGDGLTNTQEAWWCTDPLNPDTDADGRSDGAEIQALKDWLANKRAGPPGETPWPGWPFNATTCPDKDRDAIPNLAERWELGLNMDLESSDRDKFDDGQELFGVTYCPGGDLSCGYGDLPRAQDSGYVGAVMPAWVKAPGNHPLAAAFPVPEVDVVPSSLRGVTVTTVTTDHTIASGTERSYSCLL
ncbi:MAG: hypothetical protein N2439_16715, partial [Anaerolineae bacterium]|nr:hypothetical protein [Anaerolineae bacterium]